MCMMPTCEGVGSSSQHGPGEEQGVTWIGMTASRARMYHVVALREPTHLPVAWRSRARPGCIKGAGASAHCAETMGLSGHVEARLRLCARRHARQQTGPLHTARVSTHTAVCRPVAPMVCTRPTDASEPQWLRLQGRGTKYELRDQAHRLKCTYKPRMC
jgi:hypothetical protein